MNADSKATSRTVQRILVFALLVLCFSFSSVRADDVLDQQAKSYIFSVFAPQKLPAAERARLAGRASAPARMSPDFTMRLAFIIQNWDKLSESARAELRPFVNPDALKSGGRLLPRIAALRSERIFTTQYFDIHYTTDQTDKNAVDPADAAPADGIPDYINEVADSLEHVRAVEVFAREFPGPPMEQGKARYQAYLMDLLGCGVVDELPGMNCWPNSLLGFAEPMDDDYPSSSRLYLDHDYDYPGIDALKQMRSTASHEYFHAIQFGRPGGLSNSGNLWFMEGAAVWIEDEVYDEYNDYMQYLGSSGCGSWFACPSESLNSDSDQFRPYANGLFFKFLSEVKKKPGAVRDLQDLAISANTGTDALRTYVAGTLGESMADMMLEFGLSFVDSSGYRDGAIYRPETGFDRILLSTTAQGLTDSVYGVKKMAMRIFEVTAGGGVDAIRISSLLTSDIKMGVFACAGARRGCVRVADTQMVSGLSSTNPYLYIVVARGESTAPNGYSVQMTPEKPSVCDITVVPGKWNLVFLPYTPFTTVPSSVFGVSKQMHLVSHDYTALIPSETPQPLMIKGSAFWEYHDSAATTISVNYKGSLSAQLDFTLVANQRTAIGNPGLTDIPYDDDHVRITEGAATYKLSEAVAASKIGNLYAFDPNQGIQGEFVKVQPGQPLKPFKGYVLKSYISGKVTINNP